MSLIIGDSSLDGTNEYLQTKNTKLVQLSIDIDHEPFDVTQDRTALLDAIKNASEVCKTAAPSPGQFMEAAGEVDDVYFITLSSKLSGTYNSVMTAVEMLKDEYPERFFHVFDSLSAAAGETLIMNKIRECEVAGLERESLVEAVEAFIKDMNTLFVLENYDTLILNGRINKNVAAIIKTLKIVPVMTAIEGAIESYKKVRGTNKAFQKLIDAIGERRSETKGLKCVISHCHNEERAKDLKEKIEDKYDFDEVIVVPTSHISTVYANDHGIIMAF
jgi:DegV family protein with EDD domain